MYKLRRIRFPGERIISPKIDFLWQSDTALLPALKEYNSAISNLLFSIDIFSLFVFVKGLKDKKSGTVAYVFKEIFLSGRIPERIQVAKGTEFYDMIKKLENCLRTTVFLYSTYSVKKLNYCE